MNKNITLLPLAIFLIITSPSCTEEPTKEEPVKQEAPAQEPITTPEAPPKSAQSLETTFQQEVLKSNKPVLVEFFAAWCPACQAMAPIAHEVANSNEFKDKIKLVQFDVDTSRDLAIQHNIQALPTLLYFKEGNEIERSVGYMEKETLIDKIQQVFAL